MTWISPLKMDMDISLGINEGRPSNQLVATIQKIAVYLIIPFALIVFFEAVVKNLILINLANLGICLLNEAHAAYTETT